MKITSVSIFCFFLTLFFIGCNSQSEEKPTTQIEELASPTGDKSSLPYLIKGNDGNLYMSWVEKGDSNKTSLKFSQWLGNGWAKPETIVKGDNWFVNWADYPMIAIDNAGNKIAHYLVKSSSGTYSYDINVMLKPKDSTFWSKPIIPHTDGTPTEHGFVTMLPNDDSSFTIAWLDGRNTGGRAHGDHGDSGAMTIRTAVIDIRGTISKETELDGRICDCCQTGGAMTVNGPMFVYRDRSVDEVRDMAYVSKVDGIWQESKLVAEDNWNISGCPVNGPKMASSNSTVAVAWFTAALDRPKVKVAFKSTEDFEAPIIIDDTSPVGRVDIAMINDSSAIVSWLDGGKKPAIKYRKVNRNGAMSPVYIVSEISDERGSGFPQVELHEGWLYFASTEIGKESIIRIFKSNR